MFVRKPRYSKEEFARRGNDLYERVVKPQVEAGNHMRIVAIDIESGAFAVADDSLTASKKLIALDPDAQIWCLRIGQGWVHRLGGGRRAMQA